jgi:hypothetical protein
MKQKKTSECVLDAELLKKYSSESRCCSYVDVVPDLLSKGHEKFTIRECTCLFEFLGAINKGKCIVCLDEKIREQYIAHIDKLPDDLLSFFESILTNKNQTRTENGSFEFADSEELKSTTLKDKEIYLNVAKSLTTGRIISTVEDLKSVYKSKSNIHILMRHGISCKNACEQWDEIK